MRFKPLIGKMFWLIWLPTIALMTVATAISVSATAALIILIAVDILVVYFFLTSLVGYAELRENTLFVKLGFILKREIPYEKITRITKDRKLYTDSLLSIKNSMEHVTIRYNRFDVVCVSVVTNDRFIEELNARIDAKRF